MDPKHDRAIDLLLAGRTPSEVGAAVEVCRETVWRWTKDPEFDAELRRRRSAVRSATTDALCEANLEAVRTLREAMGPAAPWPVRLRAAVIMLDRTKLQEPDNVDSWPPFGVGETGASDGSMPPPPEKYEVWQAPEGREARRGTGRGPSRRPRW